MDYFDTCVGQDHIKGTLGFYYEGFQRSNIFPNTMFEGEKGGGKTHFARRTGALLHKHVKATTGTGKPLVEVNCSTIKNVQAFVDDIYLPHLMDKSATLFLDEAHSVAPKVCDFLLSALEPGKEVNTVRHSGLMLTFDFRRLTVLAGTTESQKVFLPLLNRFDPVKLVGYKTSELAKIILQNINEPLSIDQDALDQLAALARGNARSAVRLASQINRYHDVKGTKHFTKREIGALIKILDIYPLGLTRWEVNLLRLLEKRSSVSLTSLCAMTGMTRPSQQNEESYLLKMGLMEIDGQRKLTEAGSNYLAKLK